MTLSPVQALLLEEAYDRNLKVPTDAQVDRFFADVSGVRLAAGPVVAQARRIIDACRGFARDTHAALVARREDEEAQDPERWDGQG